MRAKKIKTYWKQRFKSITEIESTGIITCLSPLIILLVGTALFVECSTWKIVNQLHFRAITFKPIEMAGQELLPSKEISDGEKRKDDSLVQSIDLCFFLVTNLFIVLLANLIFITRVCPIPPWGDRWTGKKRIVVILFYYRSPVG